MELNQVSYVINLAETLNFTAAARLSGVSQPSLTWCGENGFEPIAIGAAA